jgi:hypothetical protein
MKDLLRELRMMDPATHVALLFAILFGLLLLITIGGVLYRTRHPVDSLHVDPRGARAQFKRDLNGAWIGALLFWLAWISGAVGSTLLAGLFSFFCLREFITLQRTTRSDHRALIAAFFFVLPAAVRDRRAAALRPVHGLHPGLRLPGHTGHQCGWPATRTASSSATPRSSGASWSASTACRMHRRCCCWTSRATRDAAPSCCSSW